MELWIRVQKNKYLKEGLVKVDDLMVDENSDREWSVYQSCDTLGIYKTEQRALEVLDEIQKFIEKGCKEYKSNGDYYTSKYEYSVFQMPQE